MDPIARVLIVDDSAYIRKVIRQMLMRSPFLEVVGAARDGVEALQLVEQLRPDVVTLDLMMPEMDGVAFLKEQMARRPLPVVVVSIANEASEQVLKALDAGAVDVVQKPTALATEKVLDMGAELVAKVKAAAQVPMARLPVPASAAGRPAPAPPIRQGARQNLYDIVLIGVSTGGPQALKQLIPLLPADFPVPLAIVMHMPMGYTELYARGLDELSTLRVAEAVEGDELRPGVALIAPAGRHLSLRPGPGGAALAHLDATPFDTIHRPSVDVLFQSAAELFRQRALGVIMTGMGADGQHGAAWIKSQGGTVWTEAEESCVVYGMPRAVVEAGLSDRQVPLGELARALREVI